MKGKRRSSLGLAILATAWGGVAFAEYPPSRHLPGGHPFLRIHVAPPSALDAATYDTQRKGAPDLRVGAICSLIERNAALQAIPPAFLARLIWKESRFDAKAVSPVGAMGIAQFMPETAKREGLRNPFDPAQAISVSAKHLADMRRRYGNLGLAAIGYNAGPGRAEAFMNGRRWLPAETEDYVASILGREAEDYADPTKTYPIKPLKTGLAFMDACSKLPIIRASVRNPLITRARAQPWHVQVSRHFAKHVAVNMFRKAQKRHPGLLGSMRPVVVRERGRAGSRPQNSVRVGLPTRAAAANLCRQLRGRGAFCLVKRNGG